MIDYSLSLLPLILLPQVTQCFITMLPGLAFQDLSDRGRMFMHAAAGIPPFCLHAQDVQVAAPEPVAAPPVAPVPPGAPVAPGTPGALGAPGAPGALGAPGAPGPVPPQQPQQPTQAAAKPVEYAIPNYEQTHWWCRSPQQVQQQPFPPLVPIRKVVQHSESPSIFPCCPQSPQYVAPATAPYPPFLQYPAAVPQYTAFQFHPKTSFFKGNHPKQSSLDSDMVGTEIEEGIDDYFYPEIIPDE